MACLSQKRGVTLAIFMYYWMNSGNISVLWVNLEQYSRTDISLIMSTQLKHVILNQQKRKW